MNVSFWSEKRIAGGLLVGPILIALIGLTIMILSGAEAGFRPAVQGDLEAMAPFVDTIESQIMRFILIWIIHLLGLGLLARLLARAGAEQLAILAFALIAITVFSFTFKYGFDMAVELWAAQKMARAGSIPPLYEPLSAWTSSIARLGYTLHFVAMLGIGWAILRTDLLGPGLGWVTIGWSTLWLVGGLIGMGAPAVPLLMPAVIGAALLTN